MALDALVPLDDLPAAGPPRHPGSSAGARQIRHRAPGLYIPWMQASYIMVANKQALPYLPAGADINALSYDQLAGVGQHGPAEDRQALARLSGRAAGADAPLLRGLPLPVLHRRGRGSRSGRKRLKRCGRSLRRYGRASIRTQPATISSSKSLLSGDVWIGFDHVARVLDALRQKPDDFVAFPAPAGPKRRGYMPVLAGLAVVKGAPDVNGAMALIDYLTQSLSKRR